VFEVGVIGVPDPHFGEKVIAFVVAGEGSPVSVDEIDAECRRQLAKYKIPEMYRIVPSLPRGATGKINRKMLREMGEQQHA
jgi:long-chain acyl-CoA synthetase